MTDNTPYCVHGNELGQYCQYCKIEEKDLYIAQLESRNESWREIALARAKDLETIREVFKTPMAVVREYKGIAVGCIEDACPTVGTKLYAVPEDPALKAILGITE